MKNLNIEINKHLLTIKNYESKIIKIDCEKKDKKLDEYKKDSKLEI